MRDILVCMNHTHLSVQKTMIAVTPELIYIYFLNYIPISTVKAHVFVLLKDPNFYNSKFNPNSIYEVLY